VATTLTPVRNKPCSCGSEIGMDRGRGCSALGAHNGISTNISPESRPRVWRESVVILDMQEVSAGQLLSRKGRGRSM
jgi:hypothetical protein